MANRAFLVAVVMMGAAICGFWGRFFGETKEFPASRQAIVNPLMGYAPPGDSESPSEGCSLVYIDFTWRELEPEEGRFDWETLEVENNMDRWREEGKHAVFRFVCDKPSGEAHRDIPDWLYGKTGGDGTAYDMEYGKGYSPNYNNETFIAAHERAIRALGERYGGDTFISFVELGSLGHWGEWHVKYDAGIRRIPETPVRERYVIPYISAFPNAKILMRRPFTEAVRHGFGVYNDMAGEPESTREWLDWIQSGGVYNQTGEACIEPMPEVWKTAPVGGEMNSAIPMEQMLGGDLMATAKLIGDSHTTFLGPKVPHASDAGADELLKFMGYRLRVSRLVSRTGLFDGRQSIALTWHNDGVAPFYWDWPVYLYSMDGDGNVLDREPVDLKLTELKPGAVLETVTKLPEDFGGGRAAALGVGIEDPMTGRPAVHLAMEAGERGAIVLLLP